MQLTVASIELGHLIIHARRSEDGYRLTLNDSLAEISEPVGGKRHFFFGS